MRSNANGVKKMNNDDVQLWKMHITIITKLQKKLKHVVLHAIKAPSEN